MKHEFINVRKIFDKYKVINVPYYQRDYVWGSKNNGRNLYKFIDDIFTQYDSNPSTEYFIGTLAFCSEKVNDVIDGQQRITSLILVLSILAKEKCSDEIINANRLLLEPNNEFVINEPFYLTQELKFNLGLENNYNGQDYNVDISKTIDRIKSQINNGWGNYGRSWYDGLYNYILDKVMLISLEYNNISESLKYFLNINSLSIQLTQSDIFFSILSQSLRIAKSEYTIFSIKNKIFEIGQYVGLDKDIEGYKCYEKEKITKGADNIIYIFLNAFYKNDNNILELNETGIGKWMSFYKNEVFNDSLEASKFINKFISYINDFENIYSYFSNREGNLDKKSSICTSWILLQYEKYSDILKMMTELFKVRHNYIDDSFNLYDNNKHISYEKLNEIAKRLNLTLVWNYIRSSNKRLDGFISNISLNNNEKYKISLDDIINNISLDSIFNLSYNDKKGTSNIKINDESRIIKVIFLLQEAFLNHIVKTEKDINEYLENILFGKFTIEHIYSVNEYKDKSRLSNWQTKKNKFSDDAEFDVERCKFENLSLLNDSTNSSAGSDDINSKIKKYKEARKICNSEWEYLILSFVNDSEFYNNEAICRLNLPNRTFINIEQNTWEHQKDNNRKFNKQLLKLALEEIVRK